MGRYFFKDLGDGSFWLSTIPLSAVGLAIVGWFAFFMVPDVIANPKLLTCGSGSFNDGPICDEKDWLSEWKKMNPEDDSGNGKASFDGAGNVTITFNSPSEDYYYSSGADVVDALYAWDNFMYADFDFIKTTTVVVKVDNKTLASGTWSLDDVRKINESSPEDSARKYVENLYLNKKLNCSKPNCDNQR